MIPLLIFLQSVAGCNPLLTVKTTAVDFRVDQLNNIYLVYDTYIEKLDPNGKLLFRTSDPGFGVITSLEVSDPLKPFLFYRDQGIIYPMDNTQSLQGAPIELFRTTMQVEAVGWSRDNHYWVWDAYRSELVRLDRGLNRVNATGNLQTLLGLTLSPTQLIEVGGYWVYLVDPKQGLFVFDSYGNYYSRREINAPYGIQVLDKIILYSDGKSLCTLEKSLVNESSFPLECPSKGRVLQVNDKIYFLGDGMLSVCTTGN